MPLLAHRWMEISARCKLVGTTSLEAELEHATLLLHIAKLQRISFAKQLARGAASLMPKRGSVSFT
jgi:hypothetical protein